MDKYIITVNGNTTLKVIATDMVNTEVTAGVENFSITTSRFVAFVNNTPLFVGSIAGCVYL